MAVPPIDGVTIIQKPYGQKGIPLDPDGGILLGSDGMRLRGFGAFVDGIPVITVNGAAIDENNMRFVTAKSRIEGRLVTFEIMWRRQGSYAFPSGNGNIKFSLPYDAQTPLQGQSTALLWNFNVAGYKRSVYIDTSLTCQLVSTSLVVVSDTSPFAFTDQDIISMNCQYVASSSAVYRWE